MVSSVESVTTTSIPARVTAERLPSDCLAETVGYVHGLRAGIAGLHRKDSPRELILRIHSVRTEALTPFRSFPYPQPFSDE
jgi:hypothetical protein